MIKPKQPLGKIISTNNQFINIVSNKNPTTRKPSLPIRRSSSAQSAYSDQSCMSDRVVYSQNKKNNNLEIQVASHNIKTIDTQKQRNYYQKQKQTDKRKFQNSSLITIQTNHNLIASSNTNSQKQLKKVKNKLPVSQEQKKTEQYIHLTSFQWLIILRHCFHIENKKRFVSSIKSRTLINYVKNKVYPDSLWNKIMVVENQKRFSSHQVIQAIQKQTKWKMTLDDIFCCVGKRLSEFILIEDKIKISKQKDGKLDNKTTKDQIRQQHESAAQTARFTQNMKTNIQNKLNIYQDSHILTKQHQRLTQNYKNIDNIQMPSLVSSIQQINQKLKPSKRSTLSCFDKKQKNDPKIQLVKPQKQQLKSQKSKNQVQQRELHNQTSSQYSSSLLSNSPINPRQSASPLSSISPVLNQNSNDISFSVQEYDSSINSIIATNSNNNDQLNIQNSMISRMNECSNNIQSFQCGYNGILSLKKNLQNNISLSSNSQQKILLVRYLQQILGYTIYKNKNKQNKNINTNTPVVNFKKGANKAQSTHKPADELAAATQYFYGLKLQSRKNLSQLSNQILQRLFSSGQFSQYFYHLHALKISQYNFQLPLAIPILSANLRILNLSQNNLRSISFLKCLSPYQNLQLINLNENKLTNMGQLLSMSNLTQIHIRMNNIDHMHVSRDKMLAKKLRIIDLAGNNVQNQQDIWVVNELPLLQMVNLTGNPLIKNLYQNRVSLPNKQSPKVLKRQVITDHSQIYVFSAYTQYKDIAFSTKQKQTTKANKVQQMNQEQEPKKKELTNNYNDDRTKSRQKLKDAKQ